MNRRIRGAMLALGVIGLTIGLTACMEWLTGTEIPTLLLGPVNIVAGGRGEIVLSVKSMPGGGIASLAVVLGGIAYDQTKIANVAIEPLAGFMTLAEQFDADDGGFLIAHSCSGLPDGALCKITFDATNDPTLADFTFTKADMSMGDDDNNPIVFELQDQFAYYAK